jgi:hypothetical protein
MTSRRWHPDPAGEAATQDAARFGIGCADARRFAGERSREQHQVAEVG